MLATIPFKNVENQSVISLVVLMASIFLIFYTPTLFALGKITSNIVGMILFIISIFYLLKTINFNL